MASDVVIRAEGLGKRYIIGHQAELERYTTLRDSLSRSLRGWGRSARDMLAGKALVAGDETEEFWALKDIDFEIRRGDVVGIIGRNGAGKSTLLKVLSRITEPTEGRVTIDGRVASLLEVGTGFHPELSGRENVYLNGAILGMRREEIRRKFDEIVDFAGVEKFLDTPVKRYSSGMYVRLAFAVAAHLEPEILVVDEVLAVGDAEFQKKCLGKMQDVAGHGRTVLFVSHNMAAVRSLCSKALLLKSAQPVVSGSPETLIESYLLGKKQSYNNYISKKMKERLFIRDAEIDYKGRSVDLIFSVSSSEQANIIVNIRVKDELETPIALLSFGRTNPKLAIDVRQGITRLKTRINFDAFAIGRYKLSIDLESPFGHFVERLEDILTFELLNTDKSATLRPLEQTWGVGSIEIASGTLERSDLQ